MSRTIRGADATGTARERKRRASHERALRRHARPEVTESDPPVGQIVSHGH